MIIEDLYSERFRDLNKVIFTRTEVKSLIASLNSLFLGKSCIITLGKESYNITLNTMEIDNREITTIENSIMDCGHDIIKIRREIVLDVERELREKKSLYNDKNRANFENLLEEADALKQHYADKLKDLILFSNQLELKEKAIELKELKIQKNQADGVLPEDLEEKLKKLESNITSADHEEKSRIALKIEQIKNKMTNMRVEKVISESKQTTSVLSRVVRAMEREVSSDEKQRKKLLEKYTESHQIAPVEGERPSLNTLKKQEENFKVYMEKARGRLKKKEAELIEKEKYLSEKLIGVGNKELIDLMKNSLDKLNQQKEENEREREMLEREKLDIVNLNERIMKIWASLEKIKKSKSFDANETIRDQINSLNLDPQNLGFN